MSYFIDAEATDLAALKERLKNTDLIPSQEPLLEEISQRMSALENAGIGSLAELRANLKASKSLAALSKSSGVSADYLLLLRRTINGLFPKPRRVKDMAWLDNAAVQALQQAGLKTTQQLFEADSGQLPEIPELDEGGMAELVAISDLCRVQWVSPNYARALVAAGYDTASKVASADPEALASALQDINQDAKYYGGKVGLRDVGRLVTAAKYAP